MTPVPLSPQDVLLVAGETSADRYGARLAARLRAQPGVGDLRFFGTGGDAMQSAGVEILAHIRDLASIGPREALKHMSRYYRTFRLLLQTCRQRRPAVAVLLDFPEFNLRLAKRLKPLGVKVIYYISPQLWAWRRGRIRIVRKYVDRMLVILPFEEEYYRGRGVNVEFVGHPLLEDFQLDIPPDEAGLQLPGDRTVPAMSLLSGSRRREVEYMLPTMVEAARILMRRRPFRFLVSVAPAIEEGLVRGIVSRVLGESPERAGFYILKEDSRLLLAKSEFAMVKSGTSTLEAALVGTPFLITYKISPLSWALGNILVRSRYKGLVNLIAQDEIVPEYLQRNATPESLARAALEYLEQPEKEARMRADLAGIRALLGSRCASETAAERVAGYLEGR